MEEIKIVKPGVYYVSSDRIFHFQNGHLRIGIFCSDYEYINYRECYSDNIVNSLRECCIYYKDYIWREVPEQQGEDLLSKCKEAYTAIRKMNTLGEAIGDQLGKITNEDETEGFGILSPEEFVLHGIIKNMIKIEGGTFDMGSPIDYEFNSIKHSVTLNDFYIGKYEVTQKEWETVMGCNPSCFKGENLPVENVSWNDCQEFIKKLNELTGMNFRLPTEAEWEYAARGGRKSQGYKYSGSNNIDDVAWYGDNSSETTHQVGTKQPNELGIYDMSGNVREWCSDLYDAYYYLESPIHNPIGPIRGNGRVHRGGSVHSMGSNTAVYHRDWWYPNDANYCIGLRLAL